MKTSTAFIASMSLLLAITPLSAASTAVELMSQAGVFDRQLKPQSALPLYLQVEAMEPDNARLMVCLARQYSYLMTDATSATDKLTLGRKALAYAERAVNLEPTLGDAHLSVAICHGKLLPMLDTRQKLEASRIVKASAEQAAALAPGNDLAWHILGRWHQEMAALGGAKKLLAQLIYGNLPEASYAESARCLEKAATLNPQRLMNQIELGRTYAQMHRDDEARKFINKGLAMPVREKEDPDSKERGKATLRKLDS